MFLPCRRRFVPVDAAILHPRSDVLSAPSTLRSTGYRPGLLSNADLVETEGWERSPLAPHFDAVCFFCHTGYAKPEPQAYACALERMVVVAARAPFVGDGLSDELAVTREAGFACVVMLAGFVARHACAPRRSWSTSTPRATLGGHVGSPTDPPVRRRTAAVTRVTAPPPATPPGPAPPEVQLRISISGPDQGWCPGPRVAGGDASLCAAAPPRRPVPPDKSPGVSRARTPHFWAAGEVQEPVSSR